MTNVGSPYAASNSPLAMTPNGRSEVRKLPRQQTDGRLQSVTITDDASGNPLEPDQGVVETC